MGPSYLNETDQVVIDLLADATAELHMALRKHGYGADECRNARIKVNVLRDVLDRRGFNGDEIDQLINDI